LLNFGHTIGHGIEAAAGYGKLLHGEAISLGLLAACRLSVEKSGLAEKDAARISSALASYKLPLRLDDSIKTDAIFCALKKDKKFAAGGIRFVLLRRLGDAFVSDAVTEADIRRAIEGLR
jgi:3-dehydroquinate synthetase